MSWDVAGVFHFRCSWRGSFGLSHSSRENLPRRLHRRFAIPVSSTDVLLCQRQTNLRLGHEVDRCHVRASDASCDGSNDWRLARGIVRSFGRDRRIVLRRLRFVSAARRRSRALSASGSRRSCSHCPRGQWQQRSATCCYVTDAPFRLLIGLIEPFKKILKPPERSLLGTGPRRSSSSGV